MSPSHLQKQLTASATSVTHSVWERWLPFWHGLFYVTLVLCTVVLLVADTYPWWQYVAIFGLSLLLAVWYSFCVIVGPSYWEKHSFIAMGYLAIGWLCWLGLIILFPVYLFLLCGLYPQAFTLPPMPWKIIAGIILSVLCLWQQALIVGVVSSIFLFTCLACTAGIVLACFIAAIIQQSLKQDQLIRELEITRQELTAAERQTGVMQERQRLAREIHDTLAQGFTSIIMQVEAAEATALSDVGAVLGQVRRTARENLAEARRLMWALQPEVFDHASLPEILINLAEHWTEESSVPAKATITGTSRSLQPEIEVTLLRAAQEALANARKYAKANQVSVTLSYMDDMVVLDVQDDGVGFNLTDLLTSPFGQTSGGFGLKALRERVEQLSGTLSIESIPGEGATLAVALPAFSNQSLACPPTEATKEVD